MIEVAIAALKEVRGLDEPAAAERAA
jgi:hypothetical protein